MRKILKKLLKAIFVLKLYKVSHLEILIRDWLGIRFKPRSSDGHLKACIQWIERAWRACKKTGISAAYSLRFGWLPAYPETTGYIIPTIFDYYYYCKDRKYFDMAVSMAKWELEIQLKDGAIPNGYVGKDPTGFFLTEKQPTVFNTGMVMLGWNRAYKETKDRIFLEASKRAGNWLVSAQENNETWKKWHTPIPNVSDFHTYYTKVCQALIELHLITKNKSYLDCALRHLNWALAQQKENGWFENNSFQKGVQPLLHNIAYAIEGFLFSGIMLKNDIFIQAARKPAEVLLRKFEISKKLLKATYDEKWASKDDYECLVGEAQISFIWLKLYEVTKDARFLNSALKMNDHIKTTQKLGGLANGIRGGIKGSQPIFKEYAPFNYVNWAAKYFCDSLMLENRIMKEIEKI
ncbi:hypothetical protein J7K70_02535 [bacterium]|nr:hypothetical protein [bacterium]